MKYSACRDAVTQNIHNFRGFFDAECFAEFERLNFGDGRWGDWLVSDQRHADGRPDVMTYQTPALTEAVRVSGASYFSGVKPVSLCEPSQKGCFAERPQLHHQ